MKSVRPCNGTADVPADALPSEDADFIVDIAGFEGPLDLLLDLARRQKVDLQKLSILELADQYLGFIEAAPRLRLELAADYLVMAAWLAYLKSRLLLPDRPSGDEPPAVDLAADFARRLLRLDAIRAAGRNLMQRPRLDRDVFRRGNPEGIEGQPQVAWEANLYDLLAAYARQRETRARAHVMVRARMTWTLAQARDLLERILAGDRDWSVLADRLAGLPAAAKQTPDERRTMLASTFSASLEMARENRLDLRQDAPFAPLWVRPRQTAV